MYLAHGVQATLKRGYRLVSSNVPMHLRPGASLHSPRRPPCSRSHLGAAYRRLHHGHGCVKARRATHRAALGASSWHSGVMSLSYTKVAGHLRPSATATSTVNECTATFQRLLGEGEIWRPHRIGANKRNGTPEYVARAAVVGEWFLTYMLEAR